MNYKKSAGYTEKELVHFASDHFHAAKTLFRHCPRCFDSAGSLAHLGVELLLKTCLLHKTGQFPNEHRLRILVNRLRKHGCKVDLDQSNEGTLKMLDAFFDLRYPNPNRRIAIGSTDWASIALLVENLIQQFPTPILSEIQKLRTMYKIGPIKKGGRILKDVTKNRSNKRFSRSASRGIL